MTRGWQYIIIHNSDTVDSGTVSWPSIERFHKEVRGWKDIGYHAGCELTGFQYEALIGRALDVEGAHCKADGRNHDSLGVCAVGSFNQNPPPAAQMEVMRDRIIIPWMRYFDIPPSRIMFHRDFDRAKVCPGSAFTKEYLARFIPGVVV